MRCLFVVAVCPCATLSLRGKNPPGDDINEIRRLLPELALDAGESPGADGYTAADVLAYLHGGFEFNDEAPQLAGLEGDLKQVEEVIDHLKVQLKDLREFGY